MERAANSRPIDLAASAKAGPAPELEPQKTQTLFIVSGFSSDVVAPALQIPIHLAYEPSSRDSTELAEALAVGQDLALAQRRCSWFFGRAAKEGVNGQPSLQLWVVNTDLYSEDLLYPLAGRLNIARGKLGLPPDLFHDTVKFPAGKPIDSQAHVFA